MNLSVSLKLLVSLTFFDEIEYTLISGSILAKRLRGVKVINESEPA